MRKNILLFIIGFHALNLQAQDTIPSAPDSLQKNFFKLFQWTEKQPGEFEMIVKDYDSLKMGSNDFQYFFYSTVDKPDGKLTVFDENKHKVRSCVYRSHKMFEEKWWYSSGEKEFEGTWSENVNEYGDQLLVEYTWYYRNKKIRKHGFFNGITQTYYNDGKVESEKTFRNGKPWGPYKKFFPNGKVETEGQYFDGNKTGEWTHYNPDGTVREREH